MENSASSYIRCTVYIEMCTYECVCMCFISTYFLFFHLPLPDESHSISFVAKNRANDWTICTVWYTQCTRILCKSFSSAALNTTLMEENLNPLIVIFFHILVDFTFYLSFFCMCFFFSIWKVITFIYTRKSGLWCSVGALEL